MDTPPLTQPPVWKLWQNPIFLRYCTARLRPKNIAISVLVWLIFVGFCFAMATTTGRLAPADAARLSLWPVLIIQAMILFIFGTAQCSGGIITEADEGTIDYQRLLPMHPVSKVLGYLFGLPVREYVIFLSTMPFVIYGFWKGEVPLSVAVAIYSAFLGSTLLYHLTGLLTGTVVRNRRWAFLVSIGLVFALYTVIPQLSKFGLVFFKYLGITPVMEEHLKYFFARDYNRMVQAAQDLVAEARFFGLKFPEAVFTAFCQSGLIWVFFIMLYRRWRKTESLLLGKITAVILNAWIHLLLLGNALPLIDAGSVFPSRGFNRYLRLSGWHPEPVEAFIISVIYALVAYASVIVLTNLCTSPEEMQRRAWRKARKYGQTKLPWLSDASTSFWAAFVMGATGVLGWYLFTKGVVESKWFPGHFLTMRNLVVVGGYLLAISLCFQAILETVGRARLAMLGLFFGIVPLLVGLVVGNIHEDFRTAAVWIGGASPLVTLILGIASELSLVEVPLALSRTVPLAFQFWGCVHLVVTGYWIQRLVKQRQALAAASLDSKSASALAKV